MKKTAKLISFVLIGFGLSCSYELEKGEAPKDLIPQDTFTMVLQDVMILESYYKHQRHNVTAYAKELPKAIKPIFKKYNIDSTRYVQSMDYYAAHQEKLIEIYDQIQDSITLNTVEFEQ